MLPCYFIFHWFIKEVMAVNHDAAVFFSILGRTYPVCPALTALFSNDDRNSLFTS